MVSDIIPRVEVGRWGKIGSANVDTTIYTVTKGRILKLRSVIATNPISGRIAHVMVFDAASSEISGRRLDIMVGERDTVALNKDDLAGVQDCYSAVVAASDVSGIWLMCGGTEG